MRSPKKPNPCTPRAKFKNLGTFIVMHGVKEVAYTSPTRVLNADTGEYEIHDMPATKLVRTVFPEVGTSIQGRARRSGRTRYAQTYIIDPRMNIVKDGIQIIQ